MNKSLQDQSLSGLNDWRSHVHVTRDKSVMNDHSMESKAALKKRQDL